MKVSADNGVASDPNIAQGEEVGEREEPCGVVFHRCKASGPVVHRPSDKRDVCRQQQETEHNISDGVINIVDSDGLQRVV